MLRTFHTGSTLTVQNWGTEDPEENTKPTHLQGTYLASATPTLCSDQFSVPGWGINCHAFPNKTTGKLLPAPLQLLSPKQKTSSQRQQIPLFVECSIKISSFKAKHPTEL